MSTPPNRVGIIMIATIMTIAEEIFLLFAIRLSILLLLPDRKCNTSVEKRKNFFI